MSEVAVLLYGDTVRYPAVRHEVPLEIVDPVLFVDRDGTTLVSSSSLESDRVAEVLPGAQVVTLDELGFYELLGDGMPREEAELEAVVRALARWGVEAAVVPGDLPVALADRLREAGVALDVDAHAVEARRRAKIAGRAGGHPPRPARRRGRHGRRRGADPQRRPRATGGSRPTGSR